MRAHNAKAQDTILLFPNVLDKDRHSQFDLGNRFFYVTLYNISMFLTTVNSVLHAQP